MPHAQPLPGLLPPGARSPGSGRRRAAGSRGAGSREALPSRLSEAPAASLSNGCAGRAWPPVTSLLSLS